ncbi:uncharacterized protein LOC110739633 [Chenopodium quinoa]|uniref:Pollen Ole e 1 allergen and extensin family protein n=1 Tax=Chenopodium quinoa TaxID=63459 RepID=A0A803LGH8_CHEQI|nr:uncharacterized protein LOC110739633 [Chenopodium quinoa]
MNKLYFLLVFSVFFAVVDIHGVEGGAIITGTVFCDQCKDGHVSIFDYPLSDTNVAMVCTGSNGQTVVGQETTNMMGSYTISFGGSPDLSSCFVQITPKNGPDPNNRCGASIGPPKSLRLMFSMFDMKMYSVDPLISQPAQPLSYCSTSSPSSSPPNTTPISLPPPTTSIPPPITPVTPSVPPKAPTTPGFKLPPMFHMPSSPFTQNSACSNEYWMKPEYKCYWKLVNPEMPVALVFGPLAAQKYGNDLTLWSGLKGKGDPYKTLLRETVTALLNSYNSFHFPYNAIQVLHNFNTAMTGSTRSVLLTALRFKRANSGYGRVPCKFQACK